MFIVLGLNLGPKNPCVMVCSIDRDRATEKLIELGAVEKEIFEMPTETQEGFILSSVPVIEWLADKLDVDEESATEFFGKLLDASSDHMEAMLAAHENN